MVPLNQLPDFHDRDLTSDGERHLHCHMILTEPADNRQPLSEKFKPEALENLEQSKI